ncbi:MAG: GtrA family protein [Lachnospiraceae bacterium]|nr:GtrA family protein [Lachnospiraceae bacterium]
MNVGQKLYNLIEKIIRGILNWLSKLTGKGISEVKFEALMQFVRFGIVGVSNTLISYVLYSGSLILFQKANVFSGLDYLVAQIIAFVLSVLWSFYWNNKMVFVKQDDEKRSLWKVLIKTYISYSFTGLFLSSMLLILWIDMLGISEFIAPLLNLIISVPVNFLINKFWAFKIDKNCDDKLEK